VGLEILHEYVSLESPPRFIAMLTSPVLLTLGTVGYNIYRSTRKKPATAPEAGQVDPNDVEDNTTQDDR
jgi:hypothetical protein